MTSKPVHHGRFFSNTAKVWTMDPIRKTVEVFYERKEMINMAGGIPKSESMPIKSMNVTLIDGTEFCLKNENMVTACQYGPTKGLPVTVKLFREMIVKFHQPPTSSTPLEQGGLDVAVTTGNTEALSRMVEEITNPGDFVLVENPIWSSTLQTLNHNILKTLGVETDSKGMIPSSLRQVLSRWSPEDAVNPESDIPKVLITVPHGSNPTGATIPLDRKKEIYQICREYDILILEDDPYYYLLFDHDPVPSFLSMDEDGRVVRLDSFSKILAPGFRCGIISASAPFIEKFVFNCSAANSHPNTVGQVLYTQILQRWGLDGFLDYVKRYTVTYKEHRDIMNKAFEKHLKDLVEYTIPSGGLFFWMKVKGVKDTRKMVERRGLDLGILVIPGTFFHVGFVESSYIRISFANPTIEEIDEGARRLAVMITQELEEQKKIS